jgi:hypothetical protein
MKGQEVYLILFLDLTKVPGQDLISHLGLNSRCAPIESIIIGHHHLNGAKKASAKGSSHRLLPQEEDLCATGWPTAINEGAFIAPLVC